LERIVESSVFAAENEQQVFVAMAALRDGFGAFADALSGALSQPAGGSVAMTFDCDNACLKSFELLL